ncbi:winged helix DNA-binding protein [Candidatus Babeliales bacterium]|nr:winged helix DNA-binding protein [Candidatus Babeliales bacterium]
MKPDFEKAVYEISQKMEQLRAMQESRSHSEDLTARDMMILNVLSQRGKMPVSEISNAIPNASNSTISMNITKLWREKRMVSKTKDPENQRTTIVELTEAGKKAVEVHNKQKAERFKALFQAIEVSDEERIVLTKVLDRAIRFFEKYL